MVSPCLTSAGHVGDIQQILLGEGPRISLRTVGASHVLRMTAHSHNTYSLHL